MSGLNEHQRRRVIATFTYIDGLLQDVERVARDDPSVFAKERADFAPDEARLVRSFVSLARERMLHALDSLGIPRPAPATSARWSAGMALTFADIALSELDEATLRGYGAVDDRAARALETMASDLRAVVMRGKALMHEHDPGGLAERVAALGGTAGDVLRALERASAHHGLAEVRPLIAAAAERATASTFDIGIFGRVSAGKSSLINALVGSSALPVGATPVTAVSVRLAHGETGAIVQWLDGRVSVVDPRGIADYVTELRNPHNVKGLRAVDVRVPGVPHGLRFLDSPGVGSLSPSGPAQAFAWLPRCDLGLVLVAAGTAIRGDDLALIAGLERAGIACRVLLSKADLLRDDERQRVADYVRGELAAVLGPAHALDVTPVSTVAGCEASLVGVRNDLLASIAGDRERASAAALRARLHRLVDATEAAAAARAVLGGVELGLGRLHAVIDIIA